MNPPLKGGGRVRGGGGCHPKKYVDRGECARELREEGGGVEGAKEKGSEPL